MLLDDRIFVAGHRGLVGSAICRSLASHSYRNVLVAGREELDLSDSDATARYFDRTRPDFVFLAAAKVGGILANQEYPADFIRENLAIQSNVIEAAYRAGVKRLLFLGSSCIYPKFAAQPIAESSLLTGALEATNRPYAIAKIAGIETCWSYNRQYGTRYLAVMPANLYGPGDHFDLNSSHVLPALIRKTAQAVQNGDDEVVIWGTGTPRRELLHSDDLADACTFLMNLDEVRFGSLLTPDEPPMVNIGTGEDLTIVELATIVAAAVGFEGRMTFDLTKPDGTPRKVLDVTRVHELGWSHKIDLRSGIEAVSKSYLATTDALSSK